MQDSQDLQRVFEFGLPPVIPNIKDILEEYTTKPERLPIHYLQNNLKTLSCPRDTSSLFQFHATQLPLVQKVKRDPKTGKLLGYEEVEISCLGETAKNSLSLTRQPGPRDESLKGSSANYPFWPGGFDEEKEILNVSSKVKNLPTSDDESEFFERLFEKDLEWIPPSFEKGLELTSKSIKQGVKDIVFEEGTLVDFWQGKNKTEIDMEYEPAMSKLAKKESSIRRFLKELPDDSFSVTQEEEPKPLPILKISKTFMSRTTMTMPWAEMIDVTKPMDDFEEKVPDMAFKYPFELDTFQKQAIARLEEHENVFVAAHTSAGKTVVAEYAIALSVRHMTRTVYTSPIKALSNQKFRDFKNNFESVGLVTGDVQINPSASCLIMTTEILRSMLYNGSDVIRDLEWVVFDEIHYLNNEERGHVWEEVLIMLPQHVSIIMLSATVPNALQFANWVGEIKRKKIYVISTPKRPVPLEHFLYTGSGGKSKDEIFLLLNHEGTFLKKGFEQAKDAKLSRMSNHQKTFGAKQGKSIGFNEASEKTTYVGLINHLKENDKLPVVIFTFSRNRCDTYARIMCCVDLTTGAQKAEINGFFIKSISRLKGSDRELPQVKTVQEMLKCGIGVHHSGILPILKEVVEMMFQKGLVKLLFATETFAMGVNMPARTVVFDSCRKHDGTGFRNLLPAEYIQMAGRAGRRGLDTTGTVIILCKVHVPDLMELNNMMLGKAAKLESQFRLTYSMILNLLRVESLSVEDVMKRSFLEAGSRTLKIEDIKEKKEKVEEQLFLVEDIKRSEELMMFYSHVRDFMTLKDSLTEYIMTHPRMLKEMVPGRIVVFEDFPRLSSRFGIILSIHVTKEGTGYKRMFQILTLITEEDRYTLQEKGLLVSDSPMLTLVSHRELLDRRFQQFLYYCCSNLITFEPQLNVLGFPSHKIITIPGDQVLEFTDIVIRVDVATIVKDVNQRSLDRFRNDFPVPNLSSVLRDLWEYHGRQEYNIFNPFYDLHFKDTNIMTQMSQFVHMKQDIKQRNMISRTPQFLEEFKELFCYMKLLEEKIHMEYLLSPKSLRLHEEYESRKLVLKKLGYIDEENLVQLKGRVACEMGNQNELMVTEMVLNNVLSNCKPEEIAALLSCMVFEAKNIEEPTLPQDWPLTAKVDEIKKLARNIGEIQRECGLIEPVDQYVEQFRFGLVEVVYEWAKGKPFCEIMRLTECQEGLIVRTIQRLDEMLRDVKDAARIIGDPSLKKKMEEASECIKRDIVFAASLYTQ